MWKTVLFKVLILFIQNLTGLIIQYNFFLITLQYQVNKNDINRHMDRQVVPEPKLDNKSLFTMSVIRY